MENIDNNKTLQVMIQALLPSSQKLTYEFNYTRNHLINFEKKKKVRMVTQPF